MTFHFYYALSGLDGFVVFPRALPWATLFSPFRAGRIKGFAVVCDNGCERIRDLQKKVFMRKIAIRECCLL